MKPLMSSCLLRDHVQMPAIPARARLIRVCAYEVGSELIAANLPDRHTNAWRTPIQRPTSRHPTSRNDHTSLGPNASRPPRASAVLHIVNRFYGLPHWPTALLMVLTCTLHPSFLASRRNQTVTPSNSGQRTISRKLCPGRYQLQPDSLDNDPPCPVSHDHA